MPTVVNGVPQQRVDGTSLVYSFDNPEAPERHVTQYFELLGTGRSTIAAGWRARRPDACPGKAPRAGVMSGRRPPAPRAYVYWGSGVSIAQSKAPPINLRSFSIEADVVVPAEGARGMLIASGSRFGGWSFHFDDGRPVAIHAASQKPEDRFRVAAPGRLPSGRVKIRYDYTLGGGPGDGGMLRILASGREVASGRLGRTAYVAAGLGETFDTARDTGVLVTDHLSGDEFNGVIERIEVLPR